MTIYKQNTYCNDDNTGNPVIHEAWSPDLINKCPFDIPTHTFQSSIIKGSVSNQDVVTVSDIEDTNYNFNVQNITCNVNSGPDISYNQVSTFIFNRLSKVKTLNFRFDNTCNDDYFGCKILYTPNKLPKSVSSGNVITAPSGSLSYIKAGQQIRLVEGVTEQDLGSIISIDHTTTQITVENEVVNSFTTNADVYIEDLTIRDLKIFNNNSYNIFSNVNEYLIIPSDATLSILYRNMNSSNKVFDLMLEYFD